MTAFFGFVLPAHGVPSIAQAIRLLKRVQAEPLTASSTSGDAALVEQLLKDAQAEIESKPAEEWFGGDETKKRAGDMVESALSDLRNNDTAKMDDDISKALIQLYAGRGEPPPQNTLISATNAPPSTNQVTTAKPPDAMPPPDRAAPIVKLSPEQQRSIVLITGDHGEGTGFLVKTANGPAVMTNIHVISDNPNLKITASSGALIPFLSFKGATDRDMVMIAIKDNNYTYLPLAANCDQTVQTGDEVVTPGNSEGGEVMLNTGGKVLGIGPKRIEFDNPIYHGNSGGPVLHTKSGSVIGIVTEAVKIDVSDGIDQASFQNRNSAIAGATRYFGLRVDNVPSWEPYDWDRLQNETAFLERFDKRNRCLDCYLNAPDDDKPGDRLYLEDDKIAKANQAYFDQSNGGDSSQRMDALREWRSDMEDLAATDMDLMQNTSGFYAFDRQRATDEIAYRKALKSELDTIGDNVSRIAGLSRKNN